jgi:hypothetical protein
MLIELKDYKMLARDRVVRYRHTVCIRGGPVSRTGSGMGGV